MSTFPGAEAGSGGGAGAGDTDRFLGRRTNVGDGERFASAFLGGALVFFGIRRGSWPGWGLALLGAELARRGVTGWCPLYQALEANSRRGPLRPVMIERRIVVDRSPQDLYAFWRDLGNLPRVLQHIETVETIDRELSHWVAKIAGRRVEWDAKIVTDIPNELIGWRSIEGSDVENAGSVRFTPIAGGRGTEVLLTLAYHPPAGLPGKAVGLLLKGLTESQVADDLHGFKQAMEAGTAVPPPRGSGEGPVVWQ